MPGVKHCWNTSADEHSLLFLVLLFPPPGHFFGGAFSFVTFEGDLPLPLLLKAIWFFRRLGKEMCHKLPRDPNVCFIACFVLVFTLLSSSTNHRKCGKHRLSIQKPHFFLFYQLGGGISCPALHHPKSLWKPVKTFPLSPAPFIPTLSSDLCSTVAKQINREKSAGDQSSLSVLSHSKRSL